jgi:hypothetical protein
MSNDFNVEGFSFTPDTTQARTAKHTRASGGTTARSRLARRDTSTRTKREFPEALNGWDEVSRYDDEVGYMAPALRIAVIRRRSQAYSEVREGNSVAKTWHSQL